MFNEYDETEEEKLRRLLGISAPQRVDPFTGRPQSEAARVNDVVSNYTSQSPVVRDFVGPPTPTPMQEPSAFLDHWFNQSRHGAAMADPQGTLDNWYSKARATLPRIDFDPQAMLDTWFKSGSGINPVPLPAEQAGPPTPTSTEPSNWRFSNGALINDGFDMRSAAPMAAVPGAGYTSQAGPTPRPIAHPTDADYGTRLSMEPYTNPVLQALLRSQGFKREMQNAKLNNELVKAQMLYGHKQDELENKEMNNVLRTAGNIALPATVRDAAIKNSKLDPETKDMIRLDSAFTKMGPNRTPIEVGVIKDGKDEKGNPTQQIDFTELLSSVPEDIPQETLFKYLKERRRVTRDDIVRRLAEIYQKQEGPFADAPVPEALKSSKMGRKALDPKTQKEHDLIIKYLGRR